MQTIVSSTPLNLELGALGLAADPNLAKETRTTQLPDSSNGASHNVNAIQIERVKVLHKDPVALN